MTALADPNHREPAVRRGQKFCSPQCGFGCTWAGYVRAMEEADALVRRLGPGWRADVWENCGWNYAVRRGVCRITITTNGGVLSGDWIVDGYIAWINTDPQFISNRQPTPEDALREAMMLMKTTFDQLAASFSDMLNVDLELKLIEKSN